MVHDASRIVNVLNLYVPFVISPGVLSLYLHFQGHLKNNMLVKNIDAALIESVFHMMRTTKEIVTFRSKKVVIDVEGVKIVSNHLVNNNPTTILAASQAAVSAMKYNETLFASCGPRAHDDAASFDAEVEKKLTRVREAGKACVSDYKASIP